MATVLIVKAHPLDPQKSYALGALEEVSNSVRQFAPRRSD